MLLESEVRSLALYFYSFPSVRFRQKMDFMLILILLFFPSPDTFYLQMGKFGGNEWYEKHLSSLGFKPSVTHIFSLALHLASLQISASSYRTCSIFTYDFCAELLLLWEAYAKSLIIFLKCTFDD